MWPRTARFDEAIAGGYRNAVRLDVLEDEEVVATLTGTGGILVDGTVNVARSEIQRSVSGLTVVDETGSWTPREAKDLFAPTGRQIRLWRGVDYQDGTDPELLPVFTGRWYRTSVNWPTIEFGEVYDRAKIVQSAKLERVLNIAAGTLNTIAIEVLVQAAYPGAPMNLPDLDETTTSMTFEAFTDPWEHAQALAANTGHRLYFDPMGVCQMVTEPDADDPVVWKFKDTEAGNLALPNPSWDLDGSQPNAYVVIGESSSLTAPVTAWAKDLDPTSPTQYGGRYGRIVAEPIRDDKIGSLSQAQARANKERDQRVGLIDNIVVPSMVHSAFESGDVVEVEIFRDNVELIQRRVSIIDAFPLPLRGSNGMDLQCRARRITT